MNQFINKFYRYLLVGGFNTALSFSLMYLGSLCGLNYLVYSALGYTITIMLSFFMNLRYTFKTRDRLSLRLFGFMVVSFSNLAIVELLEYYLVDHCAIERPVAIFLGMIWYVASGFLFNNYLVYRNFAMPNKPTRIL